VIAAKTGIGVDRLGNIAYEAQIFAGTDYKIGGSLMECVKARKVQIATIHDVKGSRLDYQHIQDVDVVAAPIGDCNKGRNRSTQVE
jgi:hypothetical protein